jgi:hypothetical protein
MFAPAPRALEIEIVRAKTKFFANEIKRGSNNRGPCAVAITKPFDIVSVDKKTHFGD